MKGTEPGSTILVAASIKGGRGESADPQFMQIPLFSTGGVPA